MKINIRANLDYVIGYLRDGHLEGEINIPDKDYEEFKKDPIKYIEENDFRSEMELIIDSYRVESCGEISEVDYKEIIPPYPCRNCSTAPAFCCGCPKERKWKEKYRKE